MNTEQNTPKGEPILQTLAMPADTNPQGDIFGGWIMAQMDIAGGIMAKEISQSRVVTVAVDTIKFLKPVHVGDVVSCYGKLVRIGKTSMTLNLEIWVKPAPKGNNPPGNRYKVTEAAFTYVAINDEGKKQLVQRELGY